MGCPAGQDQTTPPPATKVEPYKSHLAYVKERRSEEDGEALLNEALAKIADRRTPRPDRRPAHASTDRRRTSQRIFSILVLPKVFGLTYGRSRNSATPRS